MSPIIVPLLIIGLLLILVIAWAVWQLVKCVVVILLLIVILGALWFFGALDHILMLLF